MLWTRAVQKPNLLVSDYLQTELKPLAREVVTRQYEQHPELWERYGETGYDRCVQDTEAHLAYLAEAIASSSVGLFTDYIRWACNLLSAFNVPPDDLRANLEAMRVVFSERLVAEDVPLALEYVNAGIHQLMSEGVPLVSFITPDAPHGILARQYLDALLAGSPPSATAIVFGAVKAGTPVREIYRYVFQPAQRELGRLWQSNEISVAHEHYCTAATQRIMAQLYPYFSSTPRSGLRLVGACVGGELHDIGLRMVTDIFEMEGWDTCYVGANTPLKSLMVILAERKPNVLALSATITYHLSGVREIINAVRAREDFQAVKILVGGYPFNVSPRLWREIGADGYAQDSDQAVLTAMALVGKTA